MEDTIEDALALGTDLDWTVKTPGVGRHKAYCSPYIVTVEARNPKEDNTWTITIEDGDEEVAAIGPIQSDSLGRELKAFVEDHI